jgi:pimeloyl-ACP methyl ester carboxylesterase
LVLRGEHSPILDRDVAERMAKELPRGRFVEIPRAVHTLHEDNPEAVLTALREFLGF